MKLALGTVQFGLDYGVSNQQGQVSKHHVEEILNTAKSLGIDTLDCAGAYGNSEQILGELKANEHFKLISKVPPLTAEDESIIPFVEKTLKHLQCHHIETLLFHQADNLLTHSHKLKLFSELSLLKKQNTVNNIGVSVYSPEQFIAISREYSIDTAQVPINLFDQRFLTNDIRDICKKEHITLHARSLFLQGLLLIDKADIPTYFSPYQDKLNAFSLLAKHLSCSKLTLALALLVSDQLTNEKESYNTVIEKIIVGVCNTQQLTEIVSAYQSAKALNITRDELELLADKRLAFITPSLWSL